MGSRGHQDSGPTITAERRVGSQGTPGQRPQDYGREAGRLAGARVVEGPHLRIFPGQLSVTKAQEWREKEATRV